jgi:hypothetical protein
LFNQWCSLTDANVLLQHIVAVELNTRKEIKVETLDLILTKDITEMINDGSRSLNVLADFIMRYAMLMRNKTQMKEALKAKQEEATPECRRKNQFPCALDIMTVHDVGFTWMQFKNHEKAWRDTVMNVEDDDGCGGPEPEQDNNKKSRNKSLWSSSMGGRKNGGSVLQPEGEKYYEEICSFIRNFKADQGYEVFQFVCNNKAQELGFIRKHNEMPDLPTASACAHNTGKKAVTARNLFQHSREK